MNYGRGKVTLELGEISGEWLIFHLWWPRETVPAIMQQVFYKISCILGNMMVNFSSLCCVRVDFCSSSWLVKPVVLQVCLKGIASRASEVLDHLRLKRNVTSSWLRMFPSARRNGKYCYIRHGFIKGFWICFSVLFRSQVKLYRVCFLQSTSVSCGGYAQEDFFLMPRY